VDRKEKASEGSSSLSAAMKGGVSKKDREEVDGRQKKQVNRKELYEVKRSLGKPRGKKNIESNSSQERFGKDMDTLPKGKKAEGDGKGEIEPF